MNPAHKHNVGQLIYPVSGGALSWTAAASGDNTEQNGVGIDRLALPQLFQSVQVAVIARGVLGGDETLTLDLNIQDSADNSTFTDFGTAATQVVITEDEDPVYGSTQYGVIKQNYDLRDARQYLRAQWTGDLSASGTDTAIVAVVFNFGGGFEVPHE